MAWRHCHLLCTIGVCNRGVASLQMYNSTFQTTLDASYWAICKGKGQTLVVWPWRSLSMTRTSRSKVQFRQLSSICQFFFAEDANWGVILTLNSSRSVAGEANVVRQSVHFLPDWPSLRIHFTLMLLQKSHQKSYSLGRMDSSVSGADQVSSESPWAYKYSHVQDITGSNDPLLNERTVFELPYTRSPVSTSLFSPWVNQSLLNSLPQSYWESCNSFSA